MSEPRFIIEVPGAPGAWTFVNDRQRRFCWNCFRLRKIVFIQDRNRSGLCQRCACLLREARRRRNMPPLGSLKNNSNVAKGERTRQRIVELLERHGGAMTQPEMEEALGITRGAIRYHMLRRLRDRVKRSTGPGRCTAWELVA